MITELKVRFLPSQIRSGDTSSSQVVMADILRASTTMINALANGAQSIHPRAEIDDSRQLAAQLGANSVLGGERNGKIVDGFDCGNSPLEYTSPKIGGKKLVLCTTNGTHTLEFCRDAERVFIGAFANLSAVCEKLNQHPSGLVACAGTGGMVTDEDVLFAGAVVEELSRENNAIKLDDSARIALSRWQSVSQNLSDEKPLWKILTQSHGGRNLMRLGYDHDVKFCAQIDTWSIVPELNIERWVIESGDQPTSATNASPTSQKAV